MCIVTSLNRCLYCLEGEVCCVVSLHGLQQYIFAIAQYHIFNVRSSYVCIHVWVACERVCVCDDMHVYVYCLCLCIYVVYVRVSLCAFCVFVLVSVGMCLY